MGHPSGGGDGAGDGAGDCGDESGKEHERAALQDGDAKEYVILSRYRPARRHRRRSSSHLHLHLHRPSSSLFASSVCPPSPDAILSTAIAATIPLSPATSSAARESPMSAVPGPAGSLPSQPRKSPTTLQPAPADFPHSLHRTASHTSQASAQVPSPRLSARSFSPKGQFTPRIMSRRGSAQTGIEYPYRTLSRTSSPKDAPSYTPASVHEEGWRTPATDYTPGEV